jgi:hypothetical protein
MDRIKEDTIEEKAKAQIDLISKRCCTSEEAIRNSLTELSTKTQNNLKIIQDIAHILEKFDYKYPHVVEITTAINQMLKIQNLGGPVDQSTERDFRAKSQKAIIEVLETASNFKENHNLKKFVLGLGDMINKMENNDPGSPILRMVLETANTTLRTYVKNGREELAAKIASESLPAAAATLSKTHLLRDIIEVAYNEENNRGNGSTNKEAQNTSENNPKIRT